MVGIVEWGQEYSLGIFSLFVLSFFAVVVACLFSKERRRMNVDLGSTGTGRGKEYNDQIVSSEKIYFQSKLKLFSKKLNLGF